MHPRFALPGSTSRRHEALTDYLKGSLWVLPALALVLALAAGSVLSLIDIPGDSVLYPLVFQGTPDDARTLLLGIAGTMITVIALVLGLTVVALQVSSAQYSPRILRNFLRDRPNQVVLSVFVATFAYATAGLYTVGVSAGGRTTSFPRLAVSGALVLLFASLVMLVYFIHHLGHSIQIDTIMTVAQQATSSVIDGSLPLPSEGTVRAVPEVAVTVAAWRSGYVQSVHPEHLLDLACARDVVIRLLPRVGDNVVKGTPIAKIWSPDSAATSPHPEEFVRPLAGAVLVGGERTFLQDARFGLRQLVDVASKALSPAVNDPYTAVMALDRLAHLLAQLAGRPLGDVMLRDAGGTPRVIAPFPTFKEYAELACAQIRRYGASEPYVAHALLRMLRAAGNQTDDPVRRKLLTGHVRLVLADAERQVRQPEDLVAVRADAEATLQALGG